MKKRLLACLIDEYPEYTEKELYAWIMCGKIRYGGEVFKTPSQMVKPGQKVEFLHSSYVSRGGDKLKGLIDQWNLDFNHKIILDAGASTGGFTDCVLQHGASKVYSVDVGYNQLDYRMRKDDRVVVMERCNIMSLESLDPVPDMGVADLSFRSISGAAEKIMSLISGKRLYALIKPQFEMPRTAEFDGIVKDPRDWLRILQQVREQLSAEKLGLIRADYSRVKGRKGNQEFFYEIAPQEECPDPNEQNKIIEEMLERISG